MRFAKIMFALFLAAAATIGCRGTKGSGILDANSKEAVCNFESDLASPGCLRYEADLKAKCDADRGTLQERFSCPAWENRVLARRHESIGRRLETVRTVEDLNGILDEIVETKDNDRAYDARKRFEEETAAYAAAKYCPKMLAEAKLALKPSQSLDYQTKAGNLALLEKAMFDTMFRCPNFGDAIQAVSDDLAASVNANVALPTAECSMAQLRDVLKPLIGCFCEKRFPNPLCKARNRFYDKWNKAFPGRDMNSVCPDRQRLNLAE
jgi:hypothetical protein